MQKQPNGNSCMFFAIPYAAEGLDENTQEFYLLCKKYVDI